MSHVSKAPTTSDRKRPSARGGPQVIRPALAACAVLFCAVAASDPAPTFSQTELPDPQVRIEASASSVNVCPGEEQRTRVTLAARGVSADCQPRYSWSVTGGRIEGVGPVVVWDLAGAPPGRASYEAAVMVETSAACGPRRRISTTWRVVASRCPPRITSWSYSARQKSQSAEPGLCPNIALCCRATARAGQRDVPFSAELKGGTPGASPSFKWTVWGGQLTGGQGTEAVSVRVSDAGGRNILAKVEVGGYGTAAPCSATCVTELVSASSPLRVLVRDGRYGRPVKGAQVTVRGDEGERVFPTDEGGNFERADFAPRDYLVRINAPGFNEQERRVNLGDPYGGSVFFSMVPTRGPTPPPTPMPTPEVAATPSPTPSPEVAAAASPTPAPVATPTPEPSCTGCCALNLNARDCQLVALVGLAVLGVGALCVGAAFSLWGLDGGLATVLGDEVHCTVFAPFEAPPGDCFIVQVFAHLESEAALLADRADDSDPDAKLRGTKELEGTVERGKRLDFALQMRGLETDAPTKSLVWDGGLDSVQFYVTIPEDCKPGNLIGVVTVACESVPIGHVMFKFKVAAPASAPQPATAAAVTPAPAPPEVQAQVSAPAPAPCPPAAAAPPPPPAQGQDFVRYRRAFISYASEDRSEVLKRVQMLRTLDMEFFQDLVTLEPGDKWEAQLYNYIDKSDVIYLFWSNAAKKSAWVEREVQYALLRRRASEKGLPAIVPVIIEGPPIVPPPKHLEDLHFNDKLLYLIKAEEDTRRPSGKARAKAKPKPRKRAAT